MELDFSTTLSNGLEVEIEADWHSFEDYEWMAYHQKGNKRIPFGPDQLNALECAKIDKKVETYFSNEQVKEKEND